MAKNKCLTCGKKSKADKKKACKTKGKKKAIYICTDCNRHSVKKDTLCDPKEVIPAFHCKKCGAPALKKKAVCKPKPVKA
ncbi:MAG: hypothetical protein MI802_20575 [Desulfobacterales bacterium]|nr:hypothetical protein [Desulfobacterales bacterium]